MRNELLLATIADNRPFNSRKTINFYKQYDCKPINSSPRCAQPDGMSKLAVNVTKKQKQKTLLPRSNDNKYEESKLTKG